MQNVYSVGQVSSYIKNMFAQDFLLQSVLVRGEVSNCKYHSSGHIYFTLKDRSGTIACVMFAGSRSGLAFRLEDGQQVVAGGSIEVFERDGKYQLYVRTIIREGIGNLYERFELLKKELEEKGMFSAEYKQPLPRYIRTLGVVTAPTGAVIQDIINIAGRRNPYIQIVLYPALVQGEGAAESIVTGIHAMEKYGVDVIIVGRGGGSIEDLWAFNEEIVAQAIFDCRIPVISAVGHETDTTIADFVADLRAPTPSAAAELAVFDVHDLMQEILSGRHALEQMMSRRIREYRLRMQHSQTRLEHLSPAVQIREKRSRALRLEEIMTDRIWDRIYKNRQKITLYAERLKGVSPLEKLSRGYAYLTDERGHTVSSILQVETGENIHLYVTDGQMEAEIKQIRKQ